MQKPNPQITELKLEIDDIIEYLHSDMCRGCGEIALKLDKHMQQLQNLLEKQSNENSSS
jgi:hypothetical protein